MPRQRLVIVSGSYPDIRCGVSGHTHLVAELTARRLDYDVHVLTTAAAEINRRLARNYHLHATVDSWRPRYAPVLCRKILELRPDVVHIQNPTVMYHGLAGQVMSVVAMLLKRQRPQLQLAATQHDIAVARPLTRWRFWPLLHYADAVLVSNDRDEQAVRRQFIGHDKIYRAPVSAHLAVGAPDADRRQAMRAALGYRDETVCLAHFGFVNPHRHVPTLLRAVARLRRTGRDARAVIIGGPAVGSEQHYEDCRNLAAQLKLDALVSWTGFATAEQISDNLAAADVFVSLIERGADMRNTSIITAMLAHLPIITTKNRLYFRDRDLPRFGCLLVSPSCPRQVARAVMQSLAEPPTTDFMARRAAALDPQKVWLRHVQVNDRAYRSEPPSAPPYWPALD